MIPKKIFTSFRPVLEDSPGTKDIIDEWKLLNPEYDVRYFSDADIEAFFNENTLGKPAYNILQNGVAIADFFRICYIYSEGGIWVDFDLKPFNIQDSIDDAWLESDSLFFDLGFKNISYMAIAGAAGSNIFKGAIKRITENILNEEDRIAGLNIFPGMEINGPVAFQRYIGDIFSINTAGNKFPASDTCETYTDPTGEYSFKYVNLEVPSKKYNKYHSLCKDYNILKWQDCVEGKPLEKKPESIPENIFVTLCESDEQRSNIYTRLKKNIPSVKKFNALEHNRHWDLVHYLMTHFKIPAEHHTAKKKGKMCRWATVIMVAKYVYDLKIKSPIVVLEDDVIVDDFFDFGETHWKTHQGWIKLSRWGEVFALGHDAAKMFLEQLYKIGINNNNDRWVKDNLNPLFLEIRTHNNNPGHFHLACKTNHGLIEQAAKLDNKHIKTMCLKPSDGTPYLLETPLFTSASDTNFPVVLRRYRDEQQ